jgi:hypothetical protein
MYREKHIYIIAAYSTNTIRVKNIGSFLWSIVEGTGIIYHLSFSAIVLAVSKW